jgi:hypothetical protein
MAIVAQVVLQHRQRDPLPHRCDRKGVAQHVRSHRLFDAGAVEDTRIITHHISYTTYGLVNTLRASSSRLRLVSCA